MGKSVIEAQTALATARHTSSGEQERDAERYSGTGAKDQPCEDHQGLLGDAVAECERRLQKAKQLEVAVIPNPESTNAPETQATTKQQMLDRIKLLASEMDANDEENRAMQEEIDSLYAQIDSMPE